MKKYIPNIITIIRGLLIIPVIILFLQDNRYWAGIFFIIAAFSDFIDGYLAKKWKACSDFGREADHVIDKYLAISVLAIIVIKNFINIYILVIEFLIMLVNWYMFKKNNKIDALQIGRIKTFFLSLYITLLLFDIHYLYAFYFILIFDVLVLSSYVARYINYKPRKI